MHYLFIFFRKIYFPFFLFCFGCLISCGLRTAPKNLPEEIPKPTFKNFKVQQRGQRIRLSMTISETERKNALMKLSNDFDKQDYFLVQEHKRILGCQDCEIEELPDLRILYSSDSFIRHGDKFYYYLELPKRDLKIHEYQVSHFGPEDEILSPVESMVLRQNNKFPDVPAPNLQIVQIEDEKKIIRFAFGTVVLKNITVVDDESEKLVEQKLDIAKNSETIQQMNREKIKTRTFVLKLSWPNLSYGGLKRFLGKGDFFEEQESFQVNLYRTRSGEAWPETPINIKTNKNNYYLDRLKVFIPPSRYPQMVDTHPVISPNKLSFYVDLHVQKRDTWLYNLRLVDRFGNESVASKTVKFQSPETMILGQNFGQESFVPLSD